MNHRRRKPIAKLIAGASVIGLLVMAANERVIELEAQRRSLAIDGLAGSVRSAAALAHAKWLSAGSYSTAVNLDDKQIIEIDLSTGYPSANSNGIRGMMPDIGGFSGIDNGVSYVFSLVGVSANSCNVTYSIGKAVGEPPRVTVRNNENGGDCS